MLRWRAHAENYARTTSLLHAVVAFLQNEVAIHENIQLLRFPGDSSDDGHGCLGHLSWHIGDAAVGTS